MARKTPPKMKKIRTIFGITEYQLSNGLRVLFKQVKAAPVVSVCMTFHVGSRNEVVGQTGATHILEHLLFKDSKKYNRKNGKPMTEYLELLGAAINASTWLDRTNYYELLPSEHLEKALAIEADRMRGSLFSDEDLASEMTVVRNEFERSRNNPYEILDEAVLETAFEVHPYRIPTIGIKEDIEGATEKTLREFYDQYYWPNNATLSVFGDVTRKDVEALVVKYFGKIPHSKHEIPVMTTVEPKQTKSRTCTVEKAVGVSIQSLSYKIPRGIDKDFAPLYMLAMILAGGLSSRLQKELVDTGTVAELSVSVFPLFDEGIMTFTATLNKHSNAKAIEKSMRAVIHSIKSNPVTVAEIARARERILSQIAEEHDGVFSEIRAVSESIAAGDWTLGYRFENEVKKLTKADISRVAKKYLVAEGETAGRLTDTL